MGSTADGQRGQWTRTFATRAGVDHGDDRWEMGGFIVHFFDRALIARLAIGWELLDLTTYEEGRLPRRLVAVTLRTPPWESEQAVA